MLFRSVSITHCGCYKFSPGETGPESQGKSQIDSQRRWVALSWNVGSEPSACLCICEHPLSCRTSWQSLSSFLTDYLPQRVISQKNIPMSRTSLVAKMVKCLPTMLEIRIQSLGWEDLLEREMATHSNVLAWEIPWTEEPAGLRSVKSQKSRTGLSD